MKKKLAIAVFCLVIWLLIADGYWWSKQRLASQCATEVLKAQLGNDRISLSDRDELWLGRYLAKQYICGYTEPDGRALNSARGLAYWEMLVMLPVIYRFTFAD